MAGTDTGTIYTCGWYNDGDDGYGYQWETSCAATFLLSEEEDPNLIDYHYCPFCGGRIEVSDRR